MKKKKISPLNVWLSKILLMKDQIVTVAVSSLDVGSAGSAGILAVVSLT